MKIDRIFSELKSREFQIIMEGQKYSLPHLNTLKKSLMDIAEYTGPLNERDVFLAQMLIDPIGNKNLSEAWRELSLNDLEYLMDSWFSWSGFTLGKSCRRGRG